MENQETLKRERRSKTKKKESFISGLISLISKQCIFSAMIFSAIYYIKNADFAFSEPFLAFIKNAVGFEMNVETILGFLK